jgi:glycosyltransferase involved in cell wall biosynthesis
VNGPDLPPPARPTATSIPAISVIMIARDEAARIAAALASVRWAGEIVVVDAESTDGTAEIARGLGARVVTRPWTDFADQRNAALREATGEWILSLDADEIVSPELAAEIAAVVGAFDPARGYLIPFRNYLGARWMKFGGLYPDYHLRLFRREGATFEGAVHERVQVPGPIGRLRHPIEHRTYADRADLFRKVRRYAPVEGKARAARNTTRSTVLPALLARVPYRFVRTLFFQAGWRDGADGWVHAWALALYAWLVFRSAARARGPAIHANASPAVGPDPERSDPGCASPR